MKSLFTTKRLCRAGIIAALYVGLTYAFMPLAFGAFQVRPAEALCILPLFFPEAIPALTVGCALSNLASPFAFYDVLFGSLTTLIASLSTYTVGKLIKKTAPKIIFGGLFPVILNALVIPLVIVFLCGDYAGKASAFTAYSFYALSILLTQSVWVYGLGTPLALWFVKRKTD
jgi:uncharacterized membrane protein